MTQELFGCGKHRREKKNAVEEMEIVKMEGKIEAIKTKRAEIVERQKSGRVGARETGIIHKTEAVKTEIVKNGQI